MAKRPKRPSLKDKGVDILFPQDEEPAEEEQRAPVTDEASEDASEAEEPTIENLRASVHAHMHANDRPSDVELLVFDDALQRIAGIGRVSSSFRFTEAELEALDDFVYRARKRHKVKLVKQEVVRLGLAALLAEFKERGPDSMLGRYMRHQKER